MVAVKKAATMEKCIVNGCDIVACWLSSNGLTFVMLELPLLARLRHTPSYIHHTTPDEAHVVQYSERPTVAHKSYNILCPILAGGLVL
jgi:hypothetical protein